MPNLRASSLKEGDCEARAVPRLRQRRAPPHRLGGLSPLIWLHRRVTDVSAHLERPEHKLPRRAVPRFVAARLRSTELLERAPFLANLGDALAEAARGRGGLVLLGGEAGVGKSSLVRRFCEDHRTSARVLIGACDPLATPRPLGPILDIASELGPEVQSLLRVEARRAELFQAVFRQMGAGGRLTLAAFEDIHWADEATLDLLRFVGRRLGSSRALLLATYRDDEIGRDHSLQLLLGDLASLSIVRRLTIPPLSENAVRTLAKDTGVDASNLYRQTGGNPFFVTEVIAARTSGIPTTVRDAVLARGARLRATSREVLDAAALIGPRIEPWLLEAISGGGREAVDDCVGAGMLRWDGEDLAFRHELARAAIEQAVSPSRRRILHGAVLESLRRAQGPDDLSRLAHHAEMAGDRDAVLLYAPAAARTAARVGAHREAVEQYDRALRFAADLPDETRAGLLEGRSLVTLLTDQLPEVIEDRRKALAIWRRLGNRPKQSESLRWVSRMLWVSLRLTEAEAASRAAVEVLEDLPPSHELAMAYSNMAHLEEVRYKNAEALAWGERAMSLARELGDTETLLHAMNNVGKAKLQDDDDEGWELLGGSLRLATQAGFVEHAARALFNQAQTALWRRQLDLADRYFDEGLAFCAAHDLDSWQRILQAWRSQSLLDRGRWPEAAELAAWGLGRSRSVDMHRLQLLVVIGRLQARRGEPDPATSLNEALELTAAAPDFEWIIPLRAARAEAAWLRGDLASTLDEAQVCFDVAQRRGNHRAAGELAYWMWRGGATAPSLRHIPEPYRSQIAGDWAGAAARWQELGFPYEAAQALAEGDDEQALRRALQEFERLGARPAATRVLRRLRRRGVRGIARGPRATTRASPANLTRREIEVLRLVSAGLRNAEIAQHLFVSERTVDHHVAAILGKLNVNSRLAASREAERLGIARTTSDVWT